MNVLLLLLSWILRVSLVIAASSSSSPAKPDEQEPAVDRHQQEKVATIAVLFSVPDENENSIQINLEVGRTFLFMTTHRQSKGECERLSFASVNLTLPAGGDGGDSV